MPRLINREPKAGASSPYNLTAAELLLSARTKAKCSQGAFAVLLSQVLGFDVSPESVCYYETGKHAQPAAVLLAAQALSGQPVHVPRVNVRALWRAIESRIGLAE